MVGVKKTISTAIVALAVASVVHADMMPVHPLDGGPRRSVSIGEGRVPWQLSDSNQSAALLVAIDLDSSFVRFLPQAGPEAGQPSETKPAAILTDRQNSLTLCLYALLGLGLCRSAPLVKKVHFSGIPDWYHSGGPLQIGHSFAISPDCLASAPICCLVQPECGAETPLAQYRRGAIVSRWRKSQFTPMVLAPRGPPFCSH